MTRPEDPDDRIETHPDLIDPDWQKHAELDAWLGAKKELKKRRRRERRVSTGSGYGAAGPSRWPGVLALTGLVLLLAAAVIVHQIQGHGVNELSIEYVLGLAVHTITGTPPA
ncbi:hypothetical protein [Amycolatopsis sp. FDAARGOS 1241]|uniref:hypothetical protein n=1 Tax=Amycolatopsis sp. FDAARGOS 1241 TaxID=2778070 RepID=UPI001951688F|nr:hypothetical protein [Amycolatopsis sp. FDAARGOS 1241]QRP48311.1 hypothetical protein I6J71_10860 [Amycolatopsis sp. FDAARGOS 1241]